MDFKRKLPIPKEIKEQYPVTEKLAAVKAQRDADIKAVFTGESDKFLLIIGPCSADNEEAVLDYMGRLKKVADEVQDKIIIIPRVYTNKPRTTGEGYKGMLHQPNPDEKPDMLKGIIAIRELHMRALRETGFTSADEMLYPENYRYLNDILGYVAIGARSVENQQHKLIASAIDKAVGLKNSLNGNVENALNNIISTRISNHCIFNGLEIKTEGNVLSHLILRGYQNQEGEHIQNVDYNNLTNIVQKIKEEKINNLSIIVDCNHSNSKKDFKMQRKIVEQVIKYRNENKELKKYIKGVMIESYLKEGKQNISHNMNYGQSITDACIGLKETKEIVYYINQK